MRDLFLIALSFMLYLFATFFGILIFPLVLILWFLTFIFDKRLFLLHQLTILWAKIYIWIVPLWKLKIYGREKINRNEKYVIVANHQSIMDIILLYQLHTHFKFVARSEIFKIPIIGWTMTLSKHIMLDKNSKSGIIQMINKCARAINEGSSILIFPEGTRSKDGKIHRLKEGAFKIALENHLPVLPVVLEGTYDAVPKGDLFFKKKSSFCLKIADPIPFERIQDLAPNQVAEKVRDIMIAEHQTLCEGVS